MAAARVGGSIRTRALAFLAVLGASTAGFAATEPAAAAVPSKTVIVSGTPGATSEVAAAVRAVGGTVERTLPVIDGVTARVPASAVAALSARPGVRAVSPDLTGHLMGMDPTLGYDVSNDEGSLFDVAQITHATNAWSAGYTGKGVDVALIDSGVAPVQGLTSGNVLNGPDLSFESQNPNLAHLDTYGHGTHMASIIVGRDQQASGGTYANQNSHLFVGMAPDARLISIKVAASSGAVDVSQVIAAIDWVVSHAHTDGLNIRVLNLSYGTSSTQDPSVDPLDYAVENAWHAGIVVVVAGGNDGTSRQALADPADDPLPIAVGADDPNNTDAIADDTVPQFSQHGTTQRHVDLIAPGVHILGLRDPGSVIDDNNPSAVVNSRFFRGSGTSQATAVVSGLCALYLSKYPTATPDQVKKALTSSSTPPTSVNKLYAGLGVPDINKAMSTKPPSYSQPATGATGTGSLEQARGNAHVNDGTSDLTGEQDIFGQAWNPQTWAAASASGTAWSAGDWNGNTWTGNSWTGNTWTGVTWTGNTWTGNHWTDANWSGNTWTGNHWTGNSWTGTTWTGNSWTGAIWADASWS
jgi:serine protease AprX